MNARIGFRAGGIAAALACAFLAACGGGGGGSPTPITPQATPTPTIAPTAQATSAPLSTTTTTPINLGGVSSGGVNVVSSASLTMPSVSAASTASVTLTAVAPSGVPTPSAMSIHLKKPSTLGVPSTPLAYFAVSVNSAVTITQSPAFTVNFVAAQTGNCYVVVFDTANQANGWNGMLGPQPCGSSVSFPSVALNPPFTLAANDVYVFAIVTTSASIATPTPTPSPTPTIAPTNAPAGQSSPLPNILAPTSAPGWAPYQVATAFQFPVQSGYDGAGQTVVIIGDNPPLQSDLTAFQSYFQTTVAGYGTYNIVNVGTGQTTSDTGGQAEATLDVETVMALAPGANIEFYWVGGLSNQNFTQAYNQAITDTNKPHVFSISFGGCENSYTNTTQDTTLVQGAAAGIAYVASAGDQGDECYIGPGYQIGVNSPASDPNVVGVGGNETYDPAPNGSLTSTYAWNDTDFFSGQGATGGGVSAYFTPPPYQAGVSNASTSFRSVPDVAMPAVNVAIYLNGKFQQYGGTSWSAPQMAAMLATLNQYCGGSLGANPGTWLYTAFKRGASNFFDVTQGNNQFGTDATYYKAAVGYDMTTGLGIPYGMKVAQSICGNGGVGPAFGYKPAAQSIEPIDGYGAARDTLMPAAPHNYVQDLGARAASQSSDVTIVLRATSTLALDESKVTAALRSAGFTIAKTYPDHLVIVANAPASTIDGYFRTQMHDVSQGARGVRYVNVTPATVPAEIAPYVKGVLLDNLDVYTHL